MKLNQLTVGPIVGETTQNRVRIWGRGAAHVIDDQPRRCFGAIKKLKKVPGPFYDFLRLAVFLAYPMLGFSLLHPLS